MIKSAYYLDTKEYFYYPAIWLTNFLYWASKGCFYFSFTLKSSEALNIHADHSFGDFHNYSQNWNYWVKLYTF